MISFAAWTHVNIIYLIHVLLQVCKADMEQMRGYSTEIRKPLKSLSQLLRRPIKASIPTPTMDAVEEGLLEQLFQWDERESPPCPR